MKYTLLDIVQTILSSMDSDEINSIDDNAEATQVATIVRTVYYDILQRADLPEEYYLTSLTASGDDDKPTLMTLPEDVASIKWLKYNKESVDDPYMRYEDVVLLPLEDFLDRMYQLDESESYVGTFTHNDINFLYRDDSSPTYFTTLDDRTLIFDSFDSDVDTTLQSSKVLCRVKKNIPFTMSDSFTPDLDDPQFALLINEAKALAWAELKQTTHNIAERNSRRAWISSQKNKNAIRVMSDFDKLPNFSRR